jgi:pyruvate dehydrogenase E1 component
VAVAALKALADQELLPQSKVSQAIRQFGLDPEKPDPTTV